MRTSLIALLAVLALAVSTAADLPLLPEPVSADGPVSARGPAAVPALPLLPWLDNVMTDSLDQSGPPDGALFIARKAGGDSSVILLHYNYLNAGWWDRYTRSADGGQTYAAYSQDSGFFVDGCLHGNGIDSTYSVTINRYGTGYHLYLRRSLDWGATWSDTIRIDRGTSTFTDKPMFTSRGRDLYVTYSDFSGGPNYIRMCYSHSWGDTWNSGDINVSTSGGQGSCPAVAPNGDVYVVWGQPAAWVPNTIWFNKSTSGGATWATPRQIIRLDTSPHLPRWRANHTFPAMTVDTAGKIYVCVQNAMRGNGWDVCVLTSTNGGDSWSAPVRVNDDTVLASDQFCPWIALDRFQRPHVFWYDSRNYYPTNSGDVYYSWSEDGGVTWQTNEMVNDTSPVWMSSTSSQMGDYQQIDCDTSFVHCQWSDHRNNRTSWSYIAAARRPLPVYTAVAEERRPQAWQQSRFGLGPVGPNPVVGRGRLSFTLAAAAPVRLELFDRSGRLVRTVLDADLGPGAHSVPLDTRGLVLGVYHCRLVSGNASSTRPLVVAR